MSIKLRLLLALIPVMLIFLILLIYFGILSERLLRYEHRQFVREIASSYAERFSTLTASTTTIAGTLANSVAAQPQLDQEFINRLLQNNMAGMHMGICGLGIGLEPQNPDTGGYFSYYRKDGNERVIHLSPAPGTFRQSDWYRKPLDSGTGCWTEPWFDSDCSKAQVVTCGAPIVMGGRKSGVIRVDLSIDYLAKELRKFRITEKSQSYLVTGSGRCIGSSSGLTGSGGTFWEDERFLNDAGTKAIIQKLSEGKSSSARLKNPLTGEDSRLYIRPVKPLKLNVVFVSTIEEIRAPGRRLNTILWSLCIVFLILAVVLILWTSASVARPIERLVHQAEKYTAGNFDGRLRENEGATEIRKLSKAFNAMGEEIARKIRELREAQKEIVLHLVKATEHRDADTGLHIMRMSHYCAVLARACGMSPEEWDILFHASPMHDIGKIGISDTILQKPSALNEEEYSVMKTHTTIGENILSDSKSQLMKIAQIVAHYHHEKWDGSGYPHGLSGEEIPLQARIACIADVFDALTMERPYKRAWSVEEAMQELETKSGKDFDPRLVGLFKENLPEILRIKDTFRDEEQTACLHGEPAAPGPLDSSTP